MAEPATTPLAAALDSVGDRWTLLLVEALLDGPRRFGDLQRALPDIAPNVLSARLRHLEQQGLVVTQAYSKRPPRYVYELSSAGADLAGPLRLLADWGAGGPGEIEPLRHATCGTPLEVRWYCPTCTTVVHAADAAEERYL